ncbi:hypothetical protein Lal_00042257 [Lupinus albus]|nr:hypothetical protein Lal_00042257 [Lupinus albus]
MAKGQCPMEEGGSSSIVGGRTAARSDPYYSLNLQGCKHFLGVIGSPLGDCENEQWESFDVVEMYKSCLCGLYYFALGELTKAGSLTVENRLMHYLIAYILVQRNTNHAQATVNDLKLMFAIHEGILSNTREHLVDEHLIHKMKIFWYTSQWMYQEDYRTTIDIDLSDEENHVDLSIQLYAE